MFTGRSQILSATALAVVLAAGGIAALKMGRSSNVVGDVRTVGVVLDPKWKRIGLPASKFQDSVVGAGAFKCSLQLCEQEAMVIIGMRRATGLLNDVPKSGMQTGLTREKALEVLGDASPQNRSAIEDNLTGILVGPLAGFHLVRSQNSGFTGLPSSAVDLLQAGDQLVIIDVIAPKSGSEQAEAMLSEIENGIRLKGKAIVR